jgi:hypothetical protein
MKISNKLLIGLSLLIYIVPLSGYISTKIKSVDSQEFYESLTLESKSFGVESKYLKAEKVDPFNNIRIIGNNHRITLHLIKDDVYGVKTVESTQYESKINNENELVININLTSYNANQVYIFAPNFDNLFLNNISLDGLSSDKDSINIKVENASYYFSLGNNETLKSAKLQFRNSNVNLNAGDNLKNLDLDLQDSNIKANIKNFDKLTISSVNSSYKIGDDSSEQMNTANDNLKFIKYLSLVTQGKSTISLPNKISVDKIEGTLSDSTSTNLPVFLLKNLIK